MEWVQPLTDALGSAGPFVIGVLLLVLGSSAILSEETAKKKFGAFGMVARWLEERKQKRAEEEETLIKRRTQALWDEIQRVDEDRKSDRAVFSRRIEYLETTGATQHAYIVWVTEKMRAIEVWAADKGLKLPPPPFMPYHEWKASLREEDEDG